MRHRKIFACSASTIAIFIGAVSASAQAASAATANDRTTSAAQLEQTVSGQAQEADDIIVTGIRQSLSSAQNIKRNADAIVDSLVAEDIGKFPDNNASEAVCR